MTKQKLVGLTGGIGSGKTTIARAFEALGIPVYNSDNRARILSDNHPDIINRLKRIFGDDIYIGNCLQRKRVAEIVFNDKKKLSEINHIIHPIVQNDFHAWAAAYDDYPYVLNEAAVMIENELHKQFNKIILVISPVVMRVGRVAKRDGLPENAVYSRINSQMSDDEKKLFADYIITSDDHNYIIPQILEIDKELRKQY